MNNSLTKIAAASNQENIPPLSESLSPQSKSFSLDPEIENRQTLSVLQIQHLAFCTENAPFKEQETLGVGFEASHDCAEEVNTTHVHNEENFAIHVVRELLEELFLYLPINSPNAIAVNIECLNSEDRNHYNSCPIVKRESEENLGHACVTNSSATGEQVIKRNEFSVHVVDGTCANQTPLEELNVEKSLDHQSVNIDSPSQDGDNSQPISPCQESERTGICSDVVHLDSEILDIPTEEQSQKENSKSQLSTEGHHCRDLPSPDSHEGEPMPTQVNADQKLEEESRSDLSFEASPAHSCKTENMSDSLTNEKDLLDENINPCEELLSDLADFQNNEQTIQTVINEQTIQTVIKTEPISTTPKRKKNHELADVEDGECFLPEVKKEIIPAFLNGDPKHWLSPKVETDGTSKPLTPKKPVVGVASVNRRPPKPEKRTSSTEDHLPVVQGANQSEAGPEVAEFSDSEFRVVAEAFQDAESFDFLQKAGSSQVLKESALSRLSLYVKFDPLLKGNSPAREQNYRNLDPYEQKSRNPNDTFTLCKNETIEEELCSEDQISKDNTKLIDFNSPDLKDTPRSARMASVEPMQKEQKYFTDSEMKKAMQIQDLLYHERILSKEKEIWEKDKRFKKHVQQLEKSNTDLQVAMKTTRNMMELVVKMLKQWQGKKELDRVDTAGQSQKLVKERDQALEDLQNVEAAFADLHRRYEKTKLIVENMKQNESSLRDQLMESIEKLKKQEQMYEILKNRTEEKLDSANSEIETVKRVGESEIAVLGAQLKKAEMKIGSLERSLEQKNQEYAELSNIYDDLIARVGGRN